MSKAADPKRLRRLLGVLAVLLIAWAGKSFGPRLLWWGQEGADAALAARATRTAPPRVERLRLADLEVRPGEYRPGRNPFDYGTPPPPPPPSAQELAAAARRQAQDETLRRQLEAQRQAELAIPRPPEFTLKYLGNFGPPARVVAVFSDGRNIYNALKGDTIDGRFVLSEIGLESVEIRFVGFPDAPARRVPISG